MVLIKYGLVAQFGLFNLLTGKIELFLGSLGMDVFAFIAFRADPIDMEVFAKLGLELEGKHGLRKV